MSGIADTESVYPGVFKRGPGNDGYRAQVPDGRGKQTRQSGYETPLAAYNARISYLGGGTVQTSSDSVGRWFQEFLTARQLRPTTVENYQYSFRLLEPYIGTMALSAVTESELRKAYEALVRAGYSTLTIRNAHDRLKHLLKQAVREQGSAARTGDSC